MIPKVRTWVWLTLILTAPLNAADDERADDERADGHQWRIEAADCNYLVPVHKRDESGDQGQPVEMLRLRAAAGTYIYARHPVAHARLIDDLQLSVWIESDRRGLQVFGRIVLPDAIDPETGRRATMLVAGETYETVGRWQQLWLREIPSKVERQVRVLRARLRQPVDTRTAYLDSIVVNVYGGPGTTQVRLGQSELTGNLPPDESTQAVVTPVGYDRPDRTLAPPPQGRAGRLIVEGRPFFPRVIEYRGEPFALLRELGFNTICLERPPTADQRRQARQHGLWIIAPPPTADLSPAVEDERILGWLCGENLAFDKLPDHYLDRLRRHDPHRRPLIASVQSDQWRASRELDIVLRPTRTVGVKL